MSVYRFGQLHEEKSSLSVSTLRTDRCVTSLPILPIFVMSSPFPCMYTLSTKGTHEVSGVRPEVIAWCTDGVLGSGHPLRLRHCRSPL